MMRRTRTGTIGIAAAALCFFTAALHAQTEVEELRREVRDLKATVAEQKSAMVEQRESFESRLKEIERRAEEGAASHKADELADEVNRLMKLYQRPDAADLYPSRGIFEALKGGLFFTGLFRSRFEGRLNNIDFNSGKSGLDDQGIAFNGRFRLGFGAVLFQDPINEQMKEGEQPRNLQVTALTEFQSFGTFANNSFVNVPSAAGLPVPFAFNILTEPFRAVGIYQGYLYFQNLLADGFNVKVGRQELVFGNELILGNNSFSEGTVHDALLLNLNKETEWGVRLSFAYAKEAASDGGIAKSVRDFDEDEFAVLYGEFKAAEDLQIDGYGLYFNARSGNPDIFVTGSSATIFDGALTPPILGHTWTLGSRAFWTKIDMGGGDRLSIDGEAAFQYGADSSTAAGRRSIHGWTTEFMANYRIGFDEDGLKPIITFAYLYAGGGKPGLNGSLGFQPLFVNRHFEALRRNARDDQTRPYYPGGGRYGNTDEIPLFNVHTAKLAVSVEVAPRVEVGAGYVFAATADNQGYGTGVFGHEFDLFGSYIYSDNLQFAANLGVFLPGPSATRFSELLFFDPLRPATHSGESAAFSVYLQALLQF